MVIIVIISDLIRDVKVIIEYLTYVRKSIMHPPINQHPLTIL